LTGLITKRRIHYGWMMSVNWKMSVVESLGLITLSSWLRRLIAGLWARRADLLPRQFMWDLYWGKCHWDSFLSPSSLAFSLSISFHRGCLYLYIIWGWALGPLVAADQRQSLTPSTWTTTTATL
jgi:hypothetical protein